MSELAKVIEDALNLETDDRAALAQRMLESLDDLTEEENESLWIREAERRRSRFQSGMDVAASSASVHDKARRLLK